MARDDEGGSMKSYEVHERHEDKGEEKRLIIYSRPVWLDPEGADAIKAYDAACLRMRDDPTLVEVKLYLEGKPLGRTWRHSPKAAA
jgi:hypothetical protein